MLNYNIKNLYFLNDIGNYKENKYYLLNLINEDVQSFNCIKKNIKYIKNNFFFAFFIKEFNFIKLDKYFNKYYIYNNEPLKSIKYIFKMKKESNYFII